MIDLLKKSAEHWAECTTSAQNELLRSCLESNHTAAR